MKAGTASLIIVTICGAPVALSQTTPVLLSELAPAMDKPGPTVTQDTNILATFPTQQLRDFGFDIPTGQLSRIAQQPVAEATTQRTDLPCGFSLRRGYRNQGRIGIGFTDRPLWRGPDELARRKGIC